jgi:hypothetical protein
MIILFKTQGFKIFNLDATSKDLQNKKLQTRVGTKRLNIIIKFFTFYISLVERIYFCVLYRLSSCQG